MQQVRREDDGKEKRKESEGKEKGREGWKGIWSVRWWWCPQKDTYWITTHITKT